MKFRAFVITAATFALAVAAIGTPVFASSVHLTGIMQADFMKGTSAREIIDTFTDPGQPPFYGLGWEVIIGKVGFGGDYSASFTKTQQQTWWVDWLTQPLFVSYHFFKSGYTLDPFVQAGLGCAGRVYLQEWPESAVGSNLFISIFPYVAGGIGVDLDGFLASLKVSYAPYMTAPPASPISSYPLGNVMVTLSVGVAIDWNK